MRSDPILIIGPPRSGTSLVASIFKACGMWTGETGSTTVDCPTGFFENSAMRTLDRGLLHARGYDPAGVTRLPPPSWPEESEGLYESAIDLRFNVNKILAREGCGETEVWGFKDPKMLLTWRIWIAAYPDARIVLVNRSIEHATASCKRARFFVGHLSMDWKSWLGGQHLRMRDIEQDEGRHMQTVHVDDLETHDYSGIERAVELCGLEWNPRARLFRAELWNRASV